MRHVYRTIGYLALTAALFLTSHAAAEPTLIAPTEPVPIGGFADVEIRDLAKPDSLTWSTIPDVRVRVAAAWGKPDVPILSIPSNSAGTWNLVIAWIEGDRVTQRVVTLVIGVPTPVPPVDPNVPPVVTPDTQVTALTFVYEKDQHVIPSPVLAALNKLNRERGILATVLEADTKDGTGDVPEQYKAALEEAKKQGLPCLVVTGKKGVIRTVKNPTTEAAVMEAAQ